MKMEYVYSALLLHAAGKEISEENIVRVLQAAGIEPDITRVKALVSALEEIDIDEAISTAVAMPAAAPAPAAEAPAEEEKKEEKKEEEKKEEPSEEEAVAGLGALFG
jgi:large subunit ribosomal protein L12